MLTAERETTERGPRVAEVPAGRPGVTVEFDNVAPPRRRFTKAFQVAWLGQTVASVCWIVSVFAYGVSSVGDALQLCAASAWFVANVADLLGSDH